MKCTQCKRGFTKNIYLYSSIYIKDKLVYLCSEKCATSYRNKESFYIRKSSPYFEHVTQYNSFMEFKKAVIRFLRKISFNDILEDSFNFACHMNYQPKYQRRQIKSVNKVFEEIYGKDNVRWGFIEFIDDNSELFWGPYLVIDEVTYFYYPKNKHSLDKFIRKRLKKTSNKNFK